MLMFFMRVTDQNTLGNFTPNGYILRHLPRSGKKNVDGTASPEDEVSKFIVSLCSTISGNDLVPISLVK